MTAPITIRRRRRRRRRAPFAWSPLRLALRTLRRTAR